MFLQHLQGQWLHHLPGQPSPVPDHPFREVVFPNVQPEFYSILFYYSWAHIKKMQTHLKTSPYFPPENFKNIYFWMNFSERFY